jgi:hypothetical protein
MSHHTYLDMGDDFFSYDESIYDPQKLAAMRGQPDEELAEVRDLEHAFYRAGVDSVCNVGAMDVGHDFVLLRGITASDVNRRTDSRIVRPGGDKLGEIFFFRIEALGPVAAKLAENPDLELRMGQVNYPAGCCSHLAVGKHVFHVASSADMVDPTGEGIYQLVRAVYVPAAWDPVVTRRRIHAMMQAMSADYEKERRENLGLPEA